MNKNMLLDIFSLLVVIIVSFNFFISFYKYKIKKEKKDKIFIVLLLTIMFLTIIDGISYQFDGYCFLGSKYLMFFLNTLIWIAQVTTCILWVLYEKEYLEAKNNWIFDILLFIPIFAFIIMQIINVFNPFVFYIDDSGYYQEIKFGYYLCLGILFYYCLFMVLYPLINLLINNDKEKRRNCFLLMLFMALPLCIGIPSNYIGEINIQTPLFGIVMLIIYFNIQSKRVEEKLKLIANLKVEMAKKQNAIMLSQIQPHFLFNTLSTISFLCEKDPKLAQKTIINFASYLRVALESLEQNKLILFSQEIVNIQTYLSIERLRFHNKIRPIFILNETNFYIPPLIVLTIVENSVKYGLFQKEEGGNITVSTKLVNDYYQIIVEDDGIGFDTNILLNDIKRQNGLKIIKSKLEKCNIGTIEVTSVLGEGTKVIIYIKKGLKEDEDLCNR